MFDSDEQHLNGCPFLPQYNYNSAQFSDQKTMCQLQCCNMLQCNRRFWMLPIMSEMKMGRFRTWHNLAQLGTTWQLLPAMPGIAIGALAPWGSQGRGSRPSSRSRRCAGPADQLQRGPDQQFQQDQDQRWDKMRKEMKRDLIGGRNESGYWMIEGLITYIYIINTDEISGELDKSCLP